RRRHVARQLTRRGDAALLDPRALGDPRVGRVDHLLEVGVRHHARGRVAAGAEDANLAVHDASIVLRTADRKWSVHLLVARFFRTDERAGRRTAFRKYGTLGLLLGRLLRDDLLALVVAAGGADAVRHRRLAAVRAGHDRRGDDLVVLLAAHLALAAGGST